MFKLSFCDNLKRYFRGKQGSIKGEATGVLFPPPKKKKNLGKRFRTQDFEEMRNKGKEEENWQEYHLNMFQMFAIYIPFWETPPPQKKRLI